jgi:hypothetical protein
MTKTVTIERSSKINAPIDRVWEASAIQFEEIDKWDANVKTSRSAGGPTAIAPISGRVCNMYNGRKTVETITNFDEDGQCFTYQITEGLPGFVKSAYNTWTLCEIGGSTTELTMRIDMVVSGIIGTIMKGPIKSQMGKVLGNAQEELKHYIETSGVHPRKQKKMAKAA